MASTRRIVFVPMSVRAIACGKPRLRRTSDRKPDLGLIFCRLRLAVKSTTSRRVIYRVNFVTIKPLTSGWTFWKNELNNLIDLPHFARLMSVASGHEVNADDSETLVGVFQKFRPDGKSLHKVFERVPAGDAVMQRLRKVYETTGEARRSDGMSDAFFIVRNPAKIDPGEALEVATRFFEQLHQIAIHNDIPELMSVLDPLPTIRIMEGKAPKNPKADSEKSQLLHAMQKQAPVVIDKFLGDQEVDAQLLPEQVFAKFLGPAFYFVACDSFLRDYLLWPLVAERSVLDDPFEPYFWLWQHGAKFRIFNNNQIDFYFPRVF